MGDGPTVPVLDPVGGGEAQSAVVAAGDDHISETGPVSVGQRHLGCRGGVIEPMRTGTSVQLCDEVPAGGDHDRVEPSRSIANPRVERILCRGGHVADMDPAVINVELKPRRVALAEGKRCCRFGGVGEAVQLGQLYSTVLGFDVAEDATRADRGELLIITDQSDVRTACECELDGGVEGQGVGHAGFVDDHQGRWADRCRPVRQFAMAE
jgi:hypothetical protein